jgi:hypothetical protein
MKNNATHTHQSVSRSFGCGPGGCFQSLAKNYVNEKCQCAFADARTANLVSHHLHDRRRI